MLNLDGYSNIALIGPRGSGKSKAARKLRKMLDIPHMPLDQLIAYEAGMSISEIVKADGWHFFRHLEYQVLKKTSKMNRVIIDCGGGAIIDLDGSDNEIKSERKIKLLNKAFVIYLYADLDWLAQKITEDPTRPDLSRQKSFKELMQRRDPIYNEVANLKLNTTEMNGREIAEGIASAIEVV